MKNLPHRFYQFKVPTEGPYFDHPARRWTTIIGEFFGPISRDRAVAGLMFLNHEPKDIELRVASLDFDDLEPRIYELARRLKIQPIGKPEHGQLIGQAWGGDRWINDEKKKEAGAEARRSSLIFQLGHAACELMIDNLVREGDYWCLEKNGNQKDNPRGNVFESILHLVSNISQADFNVYIAPAPAAGTQLFTAGMSAAAKVELGEIKGDLFPNGTTAGWGKCSL